MRPPRPLAVLLALAALAVAASSVGEEPAAARQLIGLWHAKRRFGPELRGALTLRRADAAWTAEVAALTAAARHEGERLSFEMPAGRGRFQGRLLPDGRIAGHWFQPRTVAWGVGFATPVLLQQGPAGRWRGEVTPLDDEMTFHMRVQLGKGGHPAEGAKVTAFLRNPERNAARRLDVQEVVLDGEAVSLLGRRGKDDPVAELARGRYDAEARTLSLYLPWAGGTFDFRRASVADEAGFHPRARTPAPYVYRPPVADEDGWPVGTLQDAGIAPDKMAVFVKALIDIPIDSIEAPEVHALLVARRGRLVLEEYFHGFHRDQPHDTRSAAKSLTSMLVGAAILQGAPLRLDTRVHAAMSGGAAPAGLDERARALSLEHLLTMSSGLDCDDDDPASPGNEDTMQEQSAQPDWYRYALDLKMARAPGEKAVYCSAGANLAGGVLARVTGRPLAELFDELIARPLDFGPYAMNLMPSGEPYMGGGVRLRPRDFLKLGQVMLDGGRWHGRAVLGPEWARSATAGARDLGDARYGYLWWSTEVPHKERKLRAFYAAGNGGQIVMAVPELELVVAFLGGNYNHPAGRMPQQVFIPGYVLPAVGG